MIRVTTPKRPSIPSFIKKDSGQPLMNIRAMMDITIIVPVPKSGWSMIRANMINSISSIGSTPFFMFLLKILEKSFIMLYTYSRNLSCPRSSAG